jgi:hypothetical protein
MQTIGIQNYYYLNLEREPIINGSCHTLHKEFLGQLTLMCLAGHLLPPEVDSHRGAAILAPWRSLTGAAIPAAPLWKASPKPPLTAKSPQGLAIACIRLLGKKGIFLLNWIMLVLIHKRTSNLWSVSCIPRRTLPYFQSFLTMFEEILPSRYLRLTRRYS